MTIRESPRYGAPPKVRAEGIRANELAQGSPARQQVPVSPALPPPSSPTPSPAPPAAADSQKLTLDLDLRVRGRAMAIPIAKIAKVIGWLIGLVGAAVWAALRFH